MKRELITAGVGTTLGVVGTATQVNEMLQTISLIVTIIGAIISFIVVPLVNWYITAKKDGKITADEVAEAAKITSEGLAEVKKTADEERKGKNKNG